MAIFHPLFNANFSKMALHDCGVSHIFLIFLEFMRPYPYPKALLLSTYNKLDFLHQ